MIHCHKLDFHEYICLYIYCGTVWLELIAVYLVCLGQMLAYCINVEQTPPKSVFLQHASPRNPSD